MQERAQNIWNIFLGLGFFLNSKNVELASYQIRAVWLGGGPNLERRNV